jgi:hypothetical protein
MATVPNRPAFCSSSNWTSYTWTTYIAAGGNTDTGPMYTPSSPNIKCLPNDGAGFRSTEFDTRGNILDSSAESQITILLTQAKALPPLADKDTGSLKSSTDSTVGGQAAQQETPENLAATFSQNAKKLRTSFNNEYCFYHAAYVFALKELLIAATNRAFVDNTNKIPSSTIIHTEGQGQNQIQIKYGEITGSGNTIAATGFMGQVYILNSKLNQMIQLMHKLQSVRLSSLNTNYYQVFSDSTSSLNKPLFGCTKKVEGRVNYINKG